MQQDGFDLARARVSVVLNAGSGKQKGPDLAALLRERLEPQVAALRILSCRKGDELPALARSAVEDGADLVIAAGGDGTQAAVAGALAGTGCPMGVIPGGTFNYFARDLGVGETPEEAIETLLIARPAPVAVGEINGLVFLNNCSFGAYPEILKTREDVYRRWGRSRIAAYWSVLRTLTNLRHPLELTVRTRAGESHHCTAVAFVAKSAYQLDSFGLEGAQAIRDGHFALLIAQATRPLPLIGAAFRLAAGLSGKGSDFTLVEADDITIATRPARQTVAHDGEKSRLTGPFRLRIRPGALTVLCPPPGAERAA